MIPGIETPQEALEYFARHPPCFPYVFSATGRLALLGKPRCKVCDGKLPELRGETWLTEDDAGNPRICFEGLTYCPSCRMFMSHRGIVRPEKAELTIQGAGADKWRDIALVLVPNKFQELVLRVVFWLWGKKCLSLLFKENRGHE